MTDIDLDAIEQIWTPGSDEEASGSARADVDEVLALIAEVLRLRDAATDALEELDVLIGADVLAHDLTTVERCVRCRVMNAIAALRGDA